MKKIALLASAISILGIGSVHAQNDSTVASGDEGSIVAPSAQAASTTTDQEKIDELKGKLAGLEESYLETKATVDKLKKIKISGYIQAQYRYTPNFKDATDSVITGNKGAKKETYGYNVGDFAGGAFGTGMSSQFQIRRGRFKVAYETDLTQSVVQLDVIPFTSTNVASTTLNTVVDTVKDSAGVKHAVSKTVTTNNAAVLGGGGITLKDVYLRFTEPWLKSFAIKGGIFDRPYGFEIGYSSSSREMPERSRLEQTLFPGERDLGVSLEFLPSDNLPQLAQYINFKGGLFTGNGINVEIDDYRDFIGRLGLSIPLTDINLAIDLGASAYVGKIADLSDSLYEAKNGVWSGKAGQMRKAIDRQYFGGDLEVYFGDMPLIGGTCVRAEATVGKQPCYGNGSSKSFATNIASTSAIYQRNILGGYAALIQNIDPIKSQVVLRYDSFDPNTDINGDQVKLAGDVQYNTFGFGWIYHWDENVKMTLYYDNVMNEKCPSVTGLGKAAGTTVAGYNLAEDLKDDVLTFRIQYKF